jgi:hypothetical protein
MTNTTSNLSNQELTEQIERLVRQHVAEIQQAARQALERAFAGAMVERAPVARASRGSAPKERKQSKRRASSEVAALGERLYRAVCEHPGESMARLSAELGASARELHRPMALLKGAGRVRSVGERHATRYFPMATRAEAAA